MKRLHAFALIVACLAPAAHADWRYGTDTDRMTGKEVVWADIESNNSLDLRFPYNGKNYASLYVRRSPKNGLNVMVTVQKGQILCNQYTSCNVRVKFDDAAPIVFRGSESADHSSDTVFFNNEAKFLALARKAKRILVSVTMYQAGEQILEFHSSKPLDLK